MIFGSYSIALMIRLAWGPPPRKVDPVSTKKKLVLGIGGAYVVGLVVFGVLFGIKGHKNATYLPQDEFHLLTWVHLFGPVNLNKGVLYLVIAGSAHRSGSWSGSRSG